MARSSKASGPVIIKKYANRRLYNTESSSYITLDYLAQMTRDGREFKVIDAKTEEDITHNILTQIIMEAENSGQTMLPVGFLRELISLYGDSMQAMVPQYLEASMEAFRRNQTQFRQAMQGAFAGGPFAEIAKRNLDMFEAATEAFKPKGRGVAPQPASEADAADGTGDEVATLKAQMATLQAELDRLRR